jgi:alpha-beta hydrolase superfamily lysophospholipase
LRIIGHAMGGLIWLEILNRYSKWRSQVYSLILIASLLGKASLARIIDLFRLEIGISRNLEKTCRA